MEKQCFDILAERSTMTADEIAERVRHQDWWLTAQQALKYGFVDEIR